MTQCKPRRSEPERTIRHWREWEIELVKGSRKLLDAGQDLLAAAGVRPSAHPSKLARALGPGSAGSHGRSTEPETQEPLRRM